MGGMWRRRGGSAVVPALILALVQAGCGGADPGPASPDGAAEVLEIRGSEAFRLAPGESARMPGGSVLTFVAVGSDSRCPIDAVCIWQGNAEVVVRLAAGTGPDRLVRLGTSLDPRFVDIPGGRLHLDLLEPSPTASGPIDPARYRATFRFAPVVPSPGG